MHTPLVIKNTPNCQPHPWHPSVIYSAEGWNGHCWWMAQTPLPPTNIPPYRDRYELPCIHFSDDGIHWYPISNNPIDDIDESMAAAHNYLSDPHLVLHNGVLECYYRLSLLKDQQLIGNKTFLLRKISSDGIHWSDREVVADLRREEDISIWGEQIISQAVLWDGTQYRCWYVDRSGYLNNRRILMTTSADGRKWNQYSVCTLTGTPDFDPWHIDVQFFDGEYQMLLFDGWSLHFLSSLDGINYHYISLVLTPTLLFTDFYSHGIYRACSVKVNDKILVYFSAKTERQTSIGLLSTSDRKHFSPKNGISIIDYLFQYIIPGITFKNIKRYVKRKLRILFPKLFSQ